MHTLASQLPVAGQAEVVEVGLYGLMAEFESADALLAGTRRAYAAGYRAMDAYSPFPVEELAEALGSHPTRLPWITLGGGVLGALGGYGLQFWIHVLALPINAGGRGLDSWPAFIPVTFEMAVLGAGLSTLIGLLVLNHLPELYHPVFNASSFGRASRDRFFLCIEARDARFLEDEVRSFLQSLGALDVADVRE
jgi:hypothetical protein